MLVPGRRPVWRLQLSWTPVDLLVVAGHLGIGGTGGLLEEQSADDVDHTFAGESQE